MFNPLAGLYKPLRRCGFRLLPDFPKQSPSFRFFVFWLARGSESLRLLHAGTKLPGEIGSKGLTEEFVRVAALLLSKLVDLLRQVLRKADSKFTGWRRSGHILILYDPLVRVPRLSFIIRF